MNNYINTIGICFSSLIVLITGHDFYYWSQQKINNKTTIQKRTEAIIARPSLLQFKSLDREFTLPDLEIQGTIPAWLEGTLVRNGMGKFETSSEAVSHPFDGFAMLHAFSFKQGKVSYANKFLESNYYKQAMRTGTIMRGFSSDPCKLIFKKVFSYFTPQSAKIYGDNANVNVAKIAEHFIALTEMPLSIEFDSTTLKTKEPFIFDDTIKGQVTTAHPHNDFETEETFNYLTHFGKESTYNIYSVPFENKKRKLIASIPVEKPSYMHSFSITKNYIILTETPFRVNPLMLLFTDRPFIKNFAWEPEAGTIFTVVNREGGAIVGRFKGEPFFTFHHVNAFEQDNTIIIDLIAYNDPAIIDTTSFEHIFNQTDQPITTTCLKRFYIDIKQEVVTSKTLSTALIEMPQINYEYYAMKPYQYVYALGLNDTSYDLHSSSLIKINVNNSSIIEWKEKECSVSEPVFVAAPNAHAEDDGVILSIVLDTHLHHSFLLILDAKTFKEIGRAIVPHHIPWGLHGVFFKM